jgi:hypothetical protein
MRGKMKDDMDDYEEDEENFDGVVDDLDLDLDE